VTAIAAPRCTPISKSKRVKTARLYRENKVGLYNAVNVSIPAAVSVFPGENYEASELGRARVSQAHLLHWEQPRLFSEEVRAGFRVAPNRNITEKESGDGAAGEPRQAEMRRAVFGDHPPRDKEHHLASRKCRRESTPQTYPVNAAKFLAIVVDDPVGRAAPAPADIIIGRPDRPSSIVAPTRNITKVESATAPPATSPACGQQPLHHPDGPSRS